jgi:hypothetical protein
MTAKKDSIAFTEKVLNHVLFVAEVKDCQLHPVTAPGTQPTPNPPPGRNSL